MDYGVWECVSVPDTGQQVRPAMLVSWDRCILSIMVPVNQNHKQHCGLLHQAWALVKGARHKDGMGVMALEETWGVEDTQARSCVFLSPVDCTFYPGRTRELVKSVGEALEICE